MLTFKNLSCYFGYVLSDAFKPNIAYTLLPDHTGIGEIHLNDGDIVYFQIKG